MKDEAMTEHDDLAEEDDSIPTLDEIPDCPTCGRRMMWIFWGTPAGDLTQYHETQPLTDADALAYGGCMVDDPTPRWQCAGCEKRFFNDLSLDESYIAERGW